VSQTIDAKAILAIRRDWRVFPPACKIVREDEAVAFLDYTPAQRTVVDALYEHKRIYVTKYRQAKITTVLVLAILGQVMVNEGLQGLVIANAIDTGKVAFGRANYAYTNLPAPVQVPLLGGRADPAAKQIMFSHRGTIRVLTGKVSTSAIGNSPDRVLLTEYAEYVGIGEFNKHFNPSVNKRANAQIAIETTPGLHGSIQHKLWLNSYAGMSRYHAVFLPWWIDDSCKPIDPAYKRELFRPTIEELRFFEGLHAQNPIRDEDLYDRIAFRRLSIISDFDEDPASFDHKYPPGPLRGWVSSTTPKIPPDILEKLLASDAIPYKKTFYTIPDAPNYASVPDVCVYEAPNDSPDHLYLLTSDPAGLSASGDPSGIVVWDVHTGLDVAVWLGVTDANLLAHRVRAIQHYYGEKRCMIAAESNKGELLAALIALKTPNLFAYKQGSVGLYASAKTNDEARAALVAFLRAGTMAPRNKETIAELSAWDGESSGKRMVSGESGERHHFELAVCCRIAAWVFRYHDAYSRAHASAPRRRAAVATRDDGVFYPDPGDTLYAMLRKEIDRRGQRGPVIHGVGGCK
jgi:hypothetical protein